SAEELHEQPEAECDGADEKREQAEDEDGEEEPVARATLRRLFGRDRRATLQQLDVHLVRLPRRVEQVADHGYRADEVVDADVCGHAQERDFGDAVAHARGEYVERDGGRREVADAGYESDDGVEADAPARAGYAEQPVHQEAQLFETPLDLRATSLLARGQPRPAQRQTLAQSHQRILLFRRPPKSRAAKHPATRAPAN